MKRAGVLPRILRPERDKTCPSIARTPIAGISHLFARGLYSGVSEVPAHRESVDFKQLIVGDGAEPGAYPALPDGYEVKHQAEAEEHAQLKSA